MSCRQLSHLDTTSSPRCNASALQHPHVSHCAGHGSLQGLRAGVAFGSDRCLQTPGHFHPAYCKTRIALNGSRFNQRCNTNVICLLAGLMHVRRPVVLPAAFQQGRLSSCQGLRSRQTAVRAAGNDNNSGQKNGATPVCPSASEDTPHRKRSWSFL